MTRLWVQGEMGSRWPGWSRAELWTMKVDGERQHASYRPSRSSLDPCAQLLIGDTLASSMIVQPVDTNSGRRMTSPFLEHESRNASIDRVDPRVIVIRGSPFDATLFDRPMYDAWIKDVADEVR